MHTCLSLLNPDIEPVDPVFDVWGRALPKSGPAAEATAGADSGG